MNKRPALLIEARQIVQRAKSLDQSKLTLQWADGHKGMNWLSDETYLVVATVRRDKVTIIGSEEFDTTEFVGREIKGFICRVGTLVDENLPLYLGGLRVARVKRNGHDIWRVVLVDRRKGKDHIVN